MNGHSIYKWSPVFLRISAVILLIYAISFLIMPQLLGTLVGFSHHSPNTLVEVTAFYGGLELGMALYLGWSSLNRSRMHNALMMLFFVFMAAGLSRLLGIIRFGFEDLSQPVVTFLEIVWAAFSFWLTKKMTRSDYPEK